jgi:SAM-dependent methyltransferase
MTGYSYRLDDAELARYQAMASYALEHEAALWDQAGIVPAARVADLGCGPGTFLPVLTQRTSPGGQVTGVDQAADAIATARAVLKRLGLASVGLLQARAEATGLGPASVDVVFIRNVLVHNGAALAAILEHARSLLRPGGHLLAVEPDLSRLRLPDDSPDERDLEDRWIAWARSAGNDPTLGARLPDVLAAAGLAVQSHQARVDRLQVERSPAWTARRTLVEASLATPDDLARWGNAIDRRLATTGLLAVDLPVHAVVASAR